MKIRAFVFAFVALASMGCGGASSGTTANDPSTMGAQSLEGHAFAVTLVEEGQAPVKDTLKFAGGKFESTVCTPLGFPTSDYTSKSEGDATDFHALAKHPDGTTVEWQGHIQGKTIQGTATRTMSGKTSVGKFTGELQ
jgi:hypothetical protein